MHLEHTVFDWQGRRLPFFFSFVMFLYAISIRFPCLVNSSSSSWQSRPVYSHSADEWNTLARRMNRAWSRPGRVLGVLPVPAAFGDAFLQVPLEGVRAGRAGRVLAGVHVAVEGPGLRLAAAAHGAPRSAPLAEPLSSTRALRGKAPFSGGHASRKVPLGPLPNPIVYISISS